MTTLIVTLPPAPADTAALYDYVLTPDGVMVGQQSRVPLALLPLTARAGIEVVALVPAQQLSWHQVQLPPGTLTRGRFQDSGNTRLRAVLEGLLEDHLLDETAQLHFALPPRPAADAPIWVAVCNRAWLHAALQALEHSGRPVSRVVPELAPDAPTDTLCVIGEPEQAQLLLNTRTGVALWPLSSASVALLNWPEHASVQAEPAMAALAEQCFKRPVTLQQSAQRRVQALQTTWDLAQFDLLNSQGARHFRRWSAGWSQLVRAPRWRATRLALLALLLVNLIGLNAWAWREQAHLKTQRSALNTLLTETFPNVRFVVDAPVQMAKEVAALQQTKGAPSAHDLENILSAFGALAPADTRLDAIEFIANTLRIKGVKLPPEELTRMTLKLKTQGYALSTEGQTLVLQPVAGL